MVRHSGAYHNGSSRRVDRAASKSLGILQAFSNIHAVPSKVMGMAVNRNLEQEPGLAVAGVSLAGSMELTWLQCNSAQLSTGRGKD